MNGEEPIGQYSQIEVVKNKLSSPWKKSDIFIRFGEGIDIYYELRELALLYPESGVTASGSWINLDGKTLVQGKDNFMQMLRDDEVLFKKIEDRILKIIKLNKGDADGEPEQTES